MAFTELNSVEHYIIHQISGVNLNIDKVATPKSSYGAQWHYQSAEELNRGVNEVLVEVDLTAALLRLLKFPRNSSSHHA
ncbi:hypothetical protein [methanotrophic endosymbiont of Bathymodiolus puteoserpentis (Logatchev)]|uniref:hypothetical protein n=1 Tax=methanotrophic endosymbiont of Bathymodiolus puteoserpentis (Logatchev) TaxID=343235 RepID=UPI0013CA3494|nr:hypothetical protein [methanotrophic endosymbiont of Bathymodiolus puteoserpentis (Logatchev)]SHE23760.1 Type I restriction-modification system, restriction subunit R [methanotrophic endosymbiont of Bathymodiolus puteoserpentis (Logatchev)]